MSVIRRTVDLHARQEKVLLPEGLFMIDRCERPPRAGGYDIEYDPADQFISAIGPTNEGTCVAVLARRTPEDRAHGH